MCYYLATLLFYGGSKTDQIVVKSRKHKCPHVVLFHFFCSCLSIIYIYTHTRSLLTFLLPTKTTSIFLFHLHTTSKFVLPANMSTGGELLSVDPQELQFPCNFFVFCYTPRSDLICFMLHDLYVFVLFCFASRVKEADLLFYAVG